LNILRNRTLLDKIDNGICWFLCWSLCDRLHIDMERGGWGCVEGIYIDCSH